MREIIQYEANDGTVYDTVEEAFERERFLAFVADVDQFLSYGTYNEEVMDYIFQNYRLEKK